jgi:uncharacterized protein
MSPVDPAGHEVPSQCFGFCQLDAARSQCLGCRRTVGEIMAWRALSDDEKLAVWSQLPSRGGPTLAS